MKTVQQNISLTTNADNKYTLYLLAPLFFFCSIIIAGGVQQT